MLVVVQGARGAGLQGGPRRDAIAALDPCCPPILSAWTRALGAVPNIPLSPVAEAPFGLPYPPPPASIKQKDKLQVFTLYL